MKTALSDGTEANKTPQPPPQLLEASLGTAIPRFLSKTYDMVEDPLTDEVVSWSGADNSFIVWTPPEFSESLLPKYFKHSNFSSFVRQLNTYGFRKVDPDRWEFAAEGFLRGQKHLLRTLHRRKPIGQSQPQQHSGASSSQGLYVEMGKFAGLEAEIEQLKQEKNVLMQELVRMRQQQQMTQEHMKVLGQQSLLTEQGQKQIISFLAKAMQRSPFFAHLVKQNHDKKRLEGAKKGRRSPNQEVKAEKEDSTLCFWGGQIIEHQGTDPAQSTLIEILSKLKPPLAHAPSGSLEEMLQKLCKECGEPGDENSASDSEAGFVSKESTLSAGAVGDMQLSMESKDTIPSRLTIGERSHSVIPPLKTTSTAIDHNLQEMSDTPLELEVALNEKHCAFEQHLGLDGFLEGSIMTDSSWE